MNRVYGFPFPVLPVLVIAISADTQNLALQADGIGILVLGDKRVLEFVSAAKNVVAFFKYPSPSEGAGSPPSAF
jgi:hypothetical protein